jgi:parvulin-like peptidyl-prolyl isomerase
MWVMADEAQTKGIDAEPALKAILTFYQRNLVALEYRRRITAATSISDADVETLYKQNPADYTRLKVSHILIMNGDSPTVQAQNFQGGVPAAEARRLIEEVKTRLQAGGNFEELAREYSKDPGSADRGGDLGFITRGQFVPEVEDAAFALEVGATSDIVESAYGFHIIRLMDRILMPFSEVQNQIRQKMVADQVMKDIEGRVTAADVQIDEEFFKVSPAQNVR